LDHHVAFARLSVGHDGRGVLAAIRQQVFRLDDQPLEARFLNQYTQQFFPWARIPPAAKTPMRVFQPPQSSGQSRPGAQHPEHRVDQPPMVLGHTAPLSFSSGQMRLQQTPHRITEVMAVAVFSHA
jgi:hypothetical protein